MVCFLLCLCGLQLVASSNVLTADSLSISLELEFEPNWICDDEWCQILQIGFLELAVRPGALRMAITTESGTMQNVVGSQSLEGHCNDGGRHLIEVKISPNEREITYDHTTFMMSAAALLRIERAMFVRVRDGQNVNILFV